MGVIFAAIVAVAGAKYDAKEHKLSARGAAAADLRAPSAQIARVRAERTARQRAEKKIAAALAELGWKACIGEPSGARRGASSEAVPRRMPVGEKKDCDADAVTAELLTKAKTDEIDYGSDGSVTLTLTLATDELKLRK